MTAIDSIDVMMILRSCKFAFFAGGREIIGSNAMY